MQNSLFSIRALRPAPTARALRVADPSGPIAPLATTVLCLVSLLLGPTLVAGQSAPPESSEGSESKAGHACAHGSGPHGRNGERGGACPMMRGDGDQRPHHAEGSNHGAEGTRGQGARHGRMDASAPEGDRRGMGRRGGMGGVGGNHGAMRTAMTLVHQHRDAIEREVVNIPNGIVTTTWSALDPEAARTLERHVLEMKAALEKGQTIRGWDPLFAEIFQHYDEIEMVVEPIEGGVRVTETSNNPEVVKLIQAHARKVNDFLEHGPAAVHAETPLPEGYVDTRPQ